MQLMIIASSTVVPTNKPPNSKRKKPTMILIISPIFKITFLFVQKVVGAVFLILLTLSLLLGKFSIGEIICYIGLSIYHGILAFENLNANLYKKGFFHSILSVT